MEFGASQVALVKNPPANAGDTRDASLIPGSGRFLEEEMATHSSILTWEIPQTEKPGRLQSMELQRVEHDTHMESRKMLLMSQYVGKVEIQIREWTCVLTTFIQYSSYGN